jgi:hypothetical protein
MVARIQARKAFLTPVKTPVPQQREPGDPWFETAFRNIIEDGRSQPKGERNPRLYWAARRLAELGFDETRSKPALMDASAPWDHNEAGRKQSRDSIESGWNKGIANPKKKVG